MKHLSLVPVAILIAAFAAGCEMEPSTTTARSMEDGARVEKSWVRTWRDRARFECVASSSGACQIVVFVTDCPGAACRTRVLKELTLPADSTADMPQLPRDFRYCLAHGRKPIAPDCLKG
ncbi:hypothetical protein [Arenimonas sp.]|uniref:hypothetical protein n=1 Tax=Arenimonas sp. TaxID=1872635 RepID=UPI0039E6BB6B